MQKGIERKWGAHRVGIASNLCRRTPSSLEGNGLLRTCLTWGSGAIPAAEALLPPCGHSSTLSGPAISFSGLELFEGPGGWRCLGP